jgi:hypothetical protein
MLTSHPAHNKAPDHGQVFMVFIRNKFDFDVGYLIKSPCRDCDQREKEVFPQCIDECRVIDEIHTVLAEGISCNYSSSK